MRQQMIEDGSIAATYTYDTSFIIDPTSVYDSELRIIGFAALIESSGARDTNMEFEPGHFAVVYYANKVEDESGYPIERTAFHRLVEYGQENGYDLTDDYIEEPFSSPASNIHDGKGLLIRYQIALN